MSEKPEEQLTEKQTGEPAAETSAASAEPTAAATVSQDAAAVESSATEPAAAEQASPYPWAIPTVERVVQTEPLAYHRLWRGAAKYSWWRPLIAILLALIFYGVFSLVIGFFAGVALAGQLAASGGQLDTENLAAAFLPDTQKPLSIVVACVSIIVMIPSVLLAMLCVGIRPLGRIWSVTGRFRLGLFGRGFGLAAVALLLPAVLFMLIPGADSFGESGPHAFNNPDFSVSNALISAVLIILLVPFQCLAEEVVYRGMLLQVLGSWMKQPWLAMGLSAVLFAFSHIYDVWGLISVFLMGVAAVYVTWRSGGLEYAAAFHVANNLLAFGLMCSGVLPNTGQVAETGGSFLGVINQLFTCGLLVALCEWDMRRRPVQRLRVDSVLQRVPANV